MSVDGLANMIVFNYTEDKLVQVPGLPGISGMYDHEFFRQKV